VVNEVTDKSLCRQVNFLIRVWILIISILLPRYEVQSPFSESFID